MSNLGNAFNKGMQEGEDLIRAENQIIIDDIFITADTIYKTLAENLPSDKFEIRKHSVEDQYNRRQNNVVLTISTKDPALPGLKDDLLALSIEDYSTNRFKISCTYLGTTHTQYLFFTVAVKLGIANKTYTTDKMEDALSDIGTLIGAALTKPDSSCVKLKSKLGLR